MYFCTVSINSKVVSGDLDTKWRPLAEGFKAYYPTERTDNATTAWSDHATQVYITISFLAVPNVS